MKKDIFIGYLCGIIAGVAYGFHPVFVKSIMNAGISTGIIVFSRYTLATIALLIVVKFCHYSLKITWKQLVMTFLLGIFYSQGALVLYESYKYLPIGIATSILFLFPIVVAIIMIFFKNPPTWEVAFTIVLAFIGICFISQKGENETIHWKGALLAFICACTEAFFIVLCGRSQQIKKLPVLVLMFYVIFWGSVLYLFHCLFNKNYPFDEIVTILTTPVIGLNTLGLAVISTSLGITFTFISIQKIGPTKASVLRVTEPVIVPVMGRLLFNEVLTRNSLIGISLIIFSISFMFITASLKQKNEPIST